MGIAIIRDGAFNAGLVTLHFADFSRGIWILPMPTFSTIGSRNATLTMAAVVLHDVPVYT